MSTQGTATIDFGTGASDAFISVTGQAAFDAALNNVEAWIDPKATSNNTEDNHWVEEFYQPQITNKVTGTGFKIRLRVARGEAYGQYNLGWVWN